MAQRWCFFAARKITGGKAGSNGSQPPGRGGLRRLETWHLPGGPVGPPARWATISTVEGGSGTEEEAQGP